MWKAYFDIYTDIDLDVSAHVFIWCVGMCWAWLRTWAYVCVMVHCHEHENALSFLWMRKWILANEISILWDFALGVTSWNCVGATSWDYVGATSWRPERNTWCKVPRTVQKATIAEYVFYWKKMKKFESEKKKRDFYEFVYSISKRSCHIIHLHYL